MVSSTTHIDLGKGRLLGHLALQPGLKSQVGHQAVSWLRPGLITMSTGDKRLSPALASQTRSQGSLSSFLRRF